VTARQGANGHGTTFDLVAAAKAAQAEADDRPFPFTYKGKRYQMPPARGWPIEALGQLAAGNLEGALSELLGADTYAKLTKAGLTVGELNVLFAAAGREAGFPSLPNLPAPAAPSSTPT
jgi:hypothetical protein